MASKSKILAKAKSLGVKYLTNPGKVAALVACVTVSMSVNPFLPLQDAVKKCARKLNML
jgi:hypothetical protein